MAHLTDSLQLGACSWSCGLSGNPKNADHHPIARHYPDNHAVTTLAWIAALNFFPTSPTHHRWHIESTIVQ